MNPRDAGAYEGENNGRFQTLDALRGLAALAVFTMHVCVVRHHPGLLPRGYLAVDFFFLLSGFVIGQAYEKRLADGLGVLGYMRIRLLRLYPMIILGAVAASVVAVWSGEPSDIPLALAAQLAFLPFVPGVDEAFLLNGPQWSLFFELIVNLGHAMAHRILTTRRLVIVVAVSAVSLVAAELYFGNLNIGHSRINFLGGAPRAGFSFALGLLFFRLHRSGRLPSYRTPFLMWAAVFLGIMMVPFGRMGDSVFVIIALPIVFLGALPSAIPRFGRRPLALAGDISYPLYALHLPLLHAAAVFAPTIGSGGGRATLWAATLAIVLLASWAAGRFYDEPVRRRLGRALQGSSGRVPRAVAP